MLHTVSLKDNSRFRRLYRRGATVGNRYLVFYCSRSPQAVNRIGITVSAKLGHAVVRNRLRRRLREIYRLHETQFKVGYDIVVVARSNAITADFSALTQAYLSLAKKLDLLEATE